jgi:diaminohydroxyphosphoribosylaminopyrimidine deaminase/5-amino-6-(5-phosphoribosylamino)uracil reductase
MPYVTIKYAMTIDGSVAARDGSSQWITSPEARQDAHILRSRADAVVVGAGTLRNDDPVLDVRLDGYTGTQPRPVILAGSKDLPPHRKVWRRDPLVVSTVNRSIPSGELVLISGDSLPDPRATARMLAERGLLDLLVEGGPTVTSAWWAAGVVKAGVVYVGGRMAGGLGRPPMAGTFESIDMAADVTIVDVRTVGSDVRIEFS